MRWVALHDTVFKPGSKAYIPYGDILAAQEDRFHLPCSRYAHMIEGEDWLSHVALITAERDGYYSWVRERPFSDARIPNFCIGKGAAVNPHVVDLAVKPDGRRFMPAPTDQQRLAVAEFAPVRRDRGGRRSACRRRRLGPCCCDVRKPHASISWSPEGLPDQGEIPSGFRLENSSPPSPMPIAVWQNHWPLPLWSCPCHIPSRSRQRA